MNARPGSQAFVTVISFCVSVPVLSEQITVVQPSVSTADRRFTRACSFAIRCTAIASESVTVGKSPSGMNATIIPSAKMNACANGCFTKNIAETKKTMPMPIAMKEICFVSVSSSLCRGLCSSFIVCVRFAIFPNSVCIPMDTTTAFAVPLATFVPAKTKFGISKRDRPSFKAGSCVLRTGVDSPVSVDWFTCKSLVSKRRASAEILSPSSISMMSPGTRSSAEICCSCPSRMTRA